MSALAGDLPVEEASRAFFANNSERFDALVQSWPEDIREHFRKQVEFAFRDAEKATRQTARGRGHVKELITETS